MSFGFSVGDFVAVLQLARELRQKWVDAPSEYASMRDEIKNVENILRDIDDIRLKINLTPEREDALQTASESCRTVLDRCVGLINTYSSIAESGSGSKLRRRWTRLKLDPEDIRNVRNQLSPLIIQLTAVRDAIHTDLLYEINGQVNEVSTSTDLIHGDTQILRRNDELREKQMIADWFSSSAFAEQQNQFSKQRQSGTGQWFLRNDTYQGWRDGDEPSSILLCPGIPGSGKTLMFAGIIDDLVERFEGDENVAVAYFYCNFNRKEEQDLDKIYSCFIRQLFELRRTVPKEVMRLYAKHMTRNRHPSTEELTKLLHHLLAEYDRAFIMVDALDECNTENNCRNLLIDELQRISNGHGQNVVRIFMTTRLIPQITSKISDSLQIKIRAHDDDIAHYLDVRMPEIACVTKRKDLQTEIISQILQTSDGMFLLARLHFESLLEATKPKAVRQALSLLPKGEDALFKAYDKARQRIDQQLASQRNLAHKILSWITYSRRELSINELQEGIAMEDGMTTIDFEDDIDDESSIMAVCAGLVTIDNETRVVRFVHYTTQEYLRRVREQWLQYTERDIMHACLYYLSMDVFKLEKPTWHINFDQYLEKYKLLLYAGQSWGLHAKQIEVACKHRDQDRGTRSVDDMPLVQSFLRDELKVCFASQVMLAVRCYYPEGFFCGTDNITYLHVCAYFNLAKTCNELLVKSSSGLNVGDKFGRTALSWATERGHKEMVEVLLKQPDVEVNTPDVFKGTAFSQAVREKHLQIVELLLQRMNIAFDTRDIWDQTPLLLAARYVREEILELLLTLPGIEVNVSDNTGDTALAWAAFRGSGRMAKALLAQPNIKLNTRNRDGLTPLLLATRDGHQDVVELLLTHPRIEINVQDYRNRTPLLWAAREGFTEIVRMLLKRPDIDVNAKDAWDQSPLERAKFRMHTEIVDLLEKHIASQVDTELSK